MKYLRRAYGGFENGKHIWGVVGLNDIGGYSDAEVYTEKPEPPTKAEALEALIEAQRTYIQIVGTNAEKLLLAEVERLRSDVEWLADEYSKLLDSQPVKTSTEAVMERLTNMLRDMGHTVYDDKPTDAP